MKLSIIVPTYNRPLALHECIRYIYNSVHDIEGVEILIINDSKSIEIDSSNFPSIAKVHNNPKKGVASARNYGAMHAKGELLLFIDDDIIVNAENIKRILEIHNAYFNIILSPIWRYTREIYEKLDSSPFGRFRLKYDFVSTVPVATKENKLAENINLSEEDSLSSFCISLRKEYYEKLGGMDENFPYAGCEDQEFTMRAKQNGFRLLLDDSNIVFHDETHRLEQKAWLNRQYTGVQGFVLLAEKFPERKKAELWFENTPIDLSEGLKISLKKFIKLIFRQDLFLIFLKLMTRIGEYMNIPDFILFYIYNFQAGLYLNKGFAKSYKGK